MRAKSKHKILTAYIVVFFVLYSCFSLFALPGVIDVHRSAVYNAEFFGEYFSVNILFAYVRYAFMFIGMILVIVSLINYFRKKVFQGRLLVILILLLFIGLLSHFEQYGLQSFLKHGFDWTKFLFYALGTLSLIPIVFYLYSLRTEQKMGISSN